MAASAQPSSRPKWRFTCKTCASQYDTVQRMLLVTACVLCFIGMAYLFQHPAMAASSTVDQVRLDEIERRLSGLDGIPTRVSVLENQMSELVYWARGIGTAVGLAIVERALRAFGFSLRKQQ